MRCCHFSLRWLFGVVSFLAVSCGLLVYAKPFLATLTFTATLIALLAAIPGAFYSGGERRASWLGFVLFGFAYLWAVCGTWQTPDGADTLRNGLLTTAALQWCYVRAPATQTVMIQPTGGMMSGMMGGGPGMGMSSGMMAQGGMAGGSPMSPGSITMPVATAVPPNWNVFMITGHSLFALAFAFLGSAIFRGGCRRSNARKDRGEPPDG